MDLDRSERLEEHKNSASGEMGGDEILELGLGFYEELKNLAYMKYYNYLLFDTLRIFPSENLADFNGRANVLMLEGPKYSDRPFENFGKSIRGDRCECIYKRKCGINYFPTKLIKCIREFRYIN